MEKHKLKNCSLQYNSSCVHNHTNVAFPYPSPSPKVSENSPRLTSESLMLQKTDLQNFTASHSDTARTALNASCSLFLLALTQHHHTVSLVASFPVARSAVCTEAVTLNQPYQYIPTSRFFTFPKFEFSQ